LGGVDHVEGIWGLAEFPTALAAADLDSDGRVDLLVNQSQFITQLGFLSTYAMPLKEMPVSTRVPIDNQAWQLPESHQPPEQRCAPSGHSLYRHVRRDG
jgi:hypothetical protein